MAMQKNNWKKALASLFVSISAFIIAAAPAHALEVQQIFTFMDTGLGAIGRGLESIVSNDQSLLALLSLIGVLGLYAAISAALAKVKIFEGEGGVGTSKPGKALALVLSIATGAGMLRYFGTSTITSRVQSILLSHGIILGGIATIASYLLLRRAFPNRPPVVMILTGGVAIFMSVTFAQHTILFVIGVVLIIIGALRFLPSQGGEGFGQTFGGAGHHASEDSHADRDIQAHENRVRGREEQARHAETNAHSHNALIDQEMHH